MTVKKLRLFLTPDLEKEEKWLTQMSAQGLHFKKYIMCVYTFEEDPDKAYIYQIGFQQNADETYFKGFENDGWELVDHSAGMYHFFRHENKEIAAEDLHSETEMHEYYGKMWNFHMLIFISTFCVMFGTFFSLGTMSNVLQIIVVSVLGFLALVHLYILVRLFRKLKLIKSSR